MKNTRTTPGLALSALGLFALVCAPDLLASGHLAAGVSAALVAAVTGAAGAVWVIAEHRRVVRHEARRLAEHPDVEPEPPTG